MKYYTDFDDDDQLGFDEWVKKNYGRHHTVDKKSNIEKSKEKSKEILVKSMMDKYGITDSDLESPEKVKAKIRNGNIDEIIK